MNFPREFQNIKPRESSVWERKDPVQLQFFLSTHFLNFLELFHLIFDKRNDLTAHEWIHQKLTSTVVLSKRIVSTIMISKLFSMSIYCLTTLEFLKMICDRISENAKPSKAEIDLVWMGFNFREIPYREIIVESCRFEEAIGRLWKLSDFGHLLCAREEMGRIFCVKKLSTKFNSIKK